MKVNKCNGTSVVCCTTGTKVMCRLFPCEDACHHEHVTLENWEEIFHNLLDIPFPIPFVYPSITMISNMNRTHEHTHLTT